MYGCVWVRVGVNLCACMHVCACVSIAMDLYVCKIGVHACMCTRIEKTSGCMRVCVRVCVRLAHMGVCSFAGRFGFDACCYLCWCVLMDAGWCVTQSPLTHVHLA
jgi:hypothetical protein